MPGGSTIRPYKYPADTAAISRIWASTLGSTWPISDGQLGRHLAGQDRHHFGWCDVFVHDKPLGVVAYQQQRDSSHRGAIVLLAVEPAHHRKHIGTALVRHALERLRGRGVTEIELGGWAMPLFWHGVPRECVAAKTFFESFGWKYYEESYDLIVDVVNYETPARVLDAVRPLGLEFRRAGKGDQDKVLEFVSTEFPGFESYYREAFRRTTPGFVRLVLSEARVVGSMLGSNFPFCSGTHWSRLLGTSFAVLGATIVRKELRGKGIGLALTASGLEDFKLQGFQLSYFHWTWLIQMYGQLGARIWRSYDLGKLVF